MDVAEGVGKLSRVSNRLERTPSRCRFLVPSILLCVVSACAENWSAASPARAETGGFTPPAGVIEVAAPEPLEISGVAAVPGGYAVVGDDTDDHGRV